MKSKWIWYYGDFEMYHSQKLHMRRTERNVTFPAFWFLPEAYANVRFKKSVSIAKSEEITVYGNGAGYVGVNNNKYEFGKAITLPEGEYEIFIYVSNVHGLPSAYVEGESVISDETWLADYYTGKFKRVGCSELYADKNISPDKFNFAYRKLEPTAVMSHNGGVLYDYGEETFAEVRFTKINKALTVCYGETKEEATDVDGCYAFDEFDENHRKTYARGFRYIYIPDTSENEAEFEVYYEYVPQKTTGSFICDNQLFNDIWKIAAHTFELNSREFYLDGIKRDRWVWSGDAYQCYFINRYLCFDTETAKRTIIALGGKGVIEQHINTILDYTFYWIMSIYDFYEMTGDKEFVSDMFPRMKEFLDFCLGRLDKNGLMSGQKDDWVFIDWADIDKTGAVCAEQMLLLRSIETYIKCAKLLGKEYSSYSDIFSELKSKINELYWNDKLGAYIDSFESGRNNVTRHANIFAVLFDYANEEQRNSIIANVILNDEVTQLKTPYFKFYELEMLCKIGKLDCVTERISEYWGAMIAIGSTSFWEEFQPNIGVREQLDMYGTKYAKSLCHAWGSSPIYLIGRYYLGVRPTSPGYKTFEVKPNLEGFSYVDAVVPINGGTVHIKKENGKIEIESDCEGGTFITKTQMSS